MKDFEFYKIGFYITRNGIKEYTGVTLEGYFVNALEKKGIPKSELSLWLRTLIKNDKSFDPMNPVTKQVKKMIVNKIGEL